MRDGNWVVASEEKENTLTVHFDGPDKKKARNAASKALESGKKNVVVFKATRTAELSPESLQRVLPHWAF